MVVRLVGAGGLGGGDAHLPAPSFFGVVLGSSVFHVLDLFLQLLALAVELFPLELCVSPAGFGLD